MMGGMGRNPEAHIEIDAPIETVWAVMLDTEHYGEWNTFIRRVDCPSPPTVGDPIRLHVEFRPGGRRTVSPERIIAVEHPSEHGGVKQARLGYVYEGWPSRLGLVRGTRWQRLTQQPGGPTHYDTVEEFSGPLVPLAGPGRVEAGFRRHAESLKRRAESPPV